jgi:spore germination cell wall hydrolase CwlJ-like protein
MRSHTPTPRLYMFEIGETIRLPNDKRDFQITAIRDGYFDLTLGGKLIVTASAGHEVSNVSR